MGLRTANQSANLFVVHLPLLKCSMAQQSVMSPVNEPVQTIESAHVMQNFNCQCVHSNLESVLSERTFTYRAIG